MKALEIQEVLELQVVLADQGHDDIGRDPAALGALIDWKNGTATPEPEPPVKATRTKRQSRAAAPADQPPPPPERSPDPSEDDDF